MFIIDLYTYSKAMPQQLPVHVLKTNLYGPDVIYVLLYYQYIEK